MENKEDTKKLDSTKLIKANGEEYSSEELNAALRKRAQELEMLKEERRLLTNELKGKKPERYILFDEEKSPKL